MTRTSSQQRLSEPLSVAPLLNCLFRKLAEHDLRYAVLRNYERLPDQIGNDVDFLVADLACFETVVQEAARETGWEVGRKVQKLAFLSLFLVPGDLSSLAVVQLDAWSPFTWKGLEVMSHEVLQHRRLHRGLFYILSPGTEAAMSLIKGVVYHGKIQDRYKPLLPEMARSDRSCFVAALSPGFGLSLAQNLLDLTCRGRWEQIESLTSRLRRSLIRQNLRRFGLTQIRRWFGFIWGHLRQYLHPTGRFVVLIGPDGSGKSTVAQNLPELFKNLFEGTRYFHGHFEILPRLRDLAGLVGFWKAEAQPREPRSDETDACNIEFGKLRSLTYLVYYTLDYLMGYPLIFISRARGRLVVFDRYYYDYLIQPGMSLSPRLIWAAMRLVPRPDAIIYLKNDPDTILARKPELTWAELQRQGAACDQLMVRLDNGFVVQTVGSPEETSAHVARVLLGKSLKPSGLERA